MLKFSKCPNSSTPVGARLSEGRGEELPAIVGRQAEIAGEIERGPRARAHDRVEGRHCGVGMLDRHTGVVPKQEAGGFPGAGLSSEAPARASSRAGP